MYTAVYEILQRVNPRGILYFLCSLFYQGKKKLIFFISNFISVYIIFYVKLYQCNYVLLLSEYFYEFILLCLYRTYQFFNIQRI